MVLNTLRYILQHPLNHGHPIRSVQRYLAWQVGSRLLPGAVAIPFANQSILFAKPGMLGVTQNVYCGLADFIDMSFLLHLLRPQDEFVDVGANVGSYTVLASAAIGAHSNSFEPDPRIFRDLCRNLQINDIAERVTAHNAGVSSKPGTLSFLKSGPGTRVARHDDNSNETFTSPVTTLDECLLGTHPVLMKIDVEGFEAEVLAGASNTLRDPSLLALIVENNEDSVKFGFSTDRVYNVLTECGFQIASYDPLSRDLALMGTDQVIRQNSIYVRNLDEVRKRLTSAPAFTVHGRSI
jgi:FkbM family methyltransferase